MSRIILILAAAAAVAVLSINPLSARAYEAPWCTVLNMGYGDAYWDCEYASLEACVPNVLAGNCGFCNPNPVYHGPVEPPRKHMARRHRVRHY